MLENYGKVLSIEALTMVDMVKKDILPAAYTYIKRLSETALAAKSLCPQLTCESETALVSRLSALCNCLYKKADELDKTLLEAKNKTDAAEAAMFYRESVFTAMQELRAVADEMESLVGEKYWPYPTYGALLFSV